MRLESGNAFAHAQLANESVESQECFIQPLAREESIQIVGGDDAVNNGLMTAGFGALGLLGATFPVLQPIISSGVQAYINAVINDGIKP